MMLVLITLPYLALGLLVILDAKVYQPNAPSHTIAVKQNSIRWNGGYLGLTKSDYLEISRFKEVKLIRGKQEIFYQQAPPRLKVEADDTVLLGSKIQDISVDTLTSCKDAIVVVRLGKPPMLSQRRRKQLCHVAKQAFIFILALLLFKFKWSLMDTTTISEPQFKPRLQQNWIAVRHEEILGTDLVAKLPLPLTVRKEDTEVINECIRVFLAEMKEFGYSNSFADSILLPYTPSIAKLFIENPNHI